MKTLPLKSLLLAGGTNSFPTKDELGREKTRSDFGLEGKVLGTLLYWGNNHGVLYIGSQSGKSKQKSPLKLLLKYRFPPSPRASKLES